jgi:hypothetical protein
VERAERKRERKRKGAVRVNKERKEKCRVAGILSKFQHKPPATVILII